MQVFRAYFKVVRASVGTILLYQGVFAAIAILISVTSPQSAVTEFNETKTRVAVINRDSGAPLAQGLADYIADVFTVVPYADDPEKLQDGLYYRDVEYVAIIPKGFSEAFMAAGNRSLEDAAQADGSGGAAVLQKVVVPGSTSSRYVDVRIDKFLNAASLHRDLDGIGEADRVGEGSAGRQASLVVAVRADLANDAPVTLRTVGGVVDSSVESSNDYTNFFGFASYALVAMTMTGISSIMMAFNSRDLRLRNLCTPMPQRAFDLALAAGHALFGLACWAMIVVLGVVLNGVGPLLAGRTWLHLLNSLAFAVVSTAIGFAVGHFVKTSSGQSGAVNVIALGMSFLSGVFVPQSIMSRSVLTFARFLPAYWYIQANERIGALSTSVSADIYPIYQSMLIQLGFAVAMFSVTLLFAKERRRAEL